MSGGSMNYLYSQVEGAEFDRNTPERVAFAKHLKLVAQALHDIEWVDSADYGYGDDSEAIRACLDRSAVFDSSIETAKEALNDALDEIARIERARQA